MTREQIHIGDMSHETAIGILKLMLEAMETYDGISPTPERINAVKMAIEALENDPLIVPIAEIKYDEDKLKELVNKAVLTVTPQEPKSEWEYDHAILNVYSDGASEVLDKIRSEIEQIKEAEYQVYGKSSWRFVNKCLEIIDKYKAETEET